MKKIISLIIAAFFIYNAGAQRIFIKITGPTNISNLDRYEGGSTVKGHEHEIEAWSYSHGLAGCANAPIGAEKNACKVNLSSFFFTMQLNPAYMALRNTLLKGGHLDKVDMALSKISEEEFFDYYKFKMENVRIVSLQESSGGEAPAVSVELMPQIIRWEYLVQDKEGVTKSYKGGWDFGTNKPL